jgi:hypothetical protein
VFLPSATYQPLPPTKLPQFCHWTL